MQEKPGAKGQGGAAPKAEAPAAAASARSAGAAALWVFTLTTFLSALLLFSIQPMFAKMVLPVLGGAPSVWAVAMCFFQGALLVGYCFAHLIISRVPMKLTGALHLALCLAALLALPITLPASWGEPPTGEPYLWQLGLFTVAVGLPFVAVAANAPLLQAWFAATGHPHGRDPYFMYAASNLGSLIALLGYPLALEPLFGLKALSSIWAAGFVALIAALALCFLLVVRSRAVATVNRAATAAERGPAPTWSDRLGWIGLALVPSALLTAFTTHIATDVASAPLIWVIPLSLYLLTFVLVFRDRPLIFVPVLLLIGVGAAALLKVAGNPLSNRLIGADLPGWALGMGVAVLLAAFVLAYFRSGIGSTSWLLHVHLAAVIFALLQLSQTKHETWFLSSAAGVAVFFTSALVAHRTLYDARPATAHLTEFYLWMSVGGVLGGLFSALIAPKIFSEVFEYPLLLALTMACRPGAVGRAWRDREELMRLWLILAAGILMLYWVPWAVSATKLSLNDWGVAAVLAATFAVAVLAFFYHPPRQLVAALMMFLAIVWLPSGVKRGSAERSYFGVYRVMERDGFNVLQHGTTLHGAQRRRDEFGNQVDDTTPGTYYYPKSPMALAVRAVREARAREGKLGRFGIIGLGSGSLACLSEPFEAWRIFEIDPVIVRIATNRANFTFVPTCQPQPDIVLGDARLTMAKQPDGYFDLIIVDAFSSDAVPVHLMTAEAIELYKAKTSPDGVFVLHISNRYLDLDAVLAATLPATKGLKGIIVSDDTADGSYAQTTSTIAVFAKTDEALDPFRVMEGAQDFPATRLRAWTDDYSDILGPLVSKWKRRHGTAEEEPVETNSGGDGKTEKAETRN